MREYLSSYIFIGPLLIAILSAAVFRLIFKWKRSRALTGGVAAALLFALAFWGSGFPLIILDYMYSHWQVALLAGPLVIALTVSLILHLFTKFKGKIALGPGVLFSGLVYLGWGIYLLYLLVNASGSSWDALFFTIALLAVGLSASGVGVVLIRAFRKR